MREEADRLIKSKSKTFLAFCFCFIAGVGCFSFSENPDAAFNIYIFAFAVLFFIILYWHEEFYRFLLLCLLFFSLGALRFCADIPDNSPKNINYYNGAKMELAGMIAGEPDAGLSKTDYILAVSSCGDGAVRCPKNISGKVLFSLPDYPGYNYGDNIKIICTLEDPKNYPGSPFNYKNFLADRGIRSVCNATRVYYSSPSANYAVKAMKTILWLKSEVGGKVNRLWPEPGGSLMEGLLYGSKSGLPVEIINNFSRTGVSHIIAVSGFNISIIISFLMSLFIYLGLHRRYSFWLIVAVTILFVVFSGATASVVRAAVMGIILLLGQYLGRPSQMGSTLVFTAALMILINPYILIWDAGFQLSFLATLGLVYISPHIQNYLSALKFIPEIFLENLATTSAAILATFPLILFQFGKFSIVAPLVNILILWIVPWLMLFGFLSIVSGFIFFPLAQVIAWISGLGLNYVIIIVNWFGDKSWSAVEMTVPAWVMLLMYAGITYFLYVKKNKSPASGRGLQSGRQILR